VSRPWTFRRPKQRESLVSAIARCLRSLQEVREAAEREYILKKLEEAKGNVTRTAELLGLERSNLYRKMKTLGIGPKE
jgi:DNA-binding NtrC family response regulator